MLFSTFSREALFACPPFPPLFTVDFIFSSSCSRSDPPLSRQNTALSHPDSLPPHDLVFWTDGFVPYSFDKGGCGVLAICSLCGTEATLSFSAGPVCLSFSAEACAIMHALCWSWQYQQVCHFSFLLLLLSDSPSVLSFVFPFISNFVADLAETVFSLLLLRQTTMGCRTLVSPGERRG